jgi:hypothetical protein
LLHCFKYVGDCLAEKLIFYRGNFTFRSNLAILTPPSILEISAPFAISELFIEIVYLFDLPMTHTTPQLLTLEDHQVKAIQIKLFLKPIGPVRVALGYSIAFSVPSL